MADQIDFTEKETVNQCARAHAELDQIYVLAKTDGHAAVARIREVGILCGMLEASFEAAGVSSSMGKAFDWSIQLGAHLFKNMEPEEPNVG